MNVEKLYITCRKKCNGLIMAVFSPRVSKSHLGGFFDHTWMCTGMCMKAENKIC